MTARTPGTPMSGAAGSSAPPLEICVRAAGPEDLAYVAQDGYIPEPVLRRKVAEGEVFVAEVAGERAGYVRLEHLWSVVPYIALIWVRPACRGRGVGAALLDAICAVLRAHGQAALYSSSQADEPEPQAWHRRMGFEECGFIGGINDGVGEVFFRKRL